MRTEDLSQQNAVLLLQNENVVLMRELAKAQQRITTLLATKARECELIQAQLMQALAALAKRDAIIGVLRADLSDVNGRMSTPHGARDMTSQPSQPSRRQ